MSTFWSSVPPGSTARLSLPITTRADGSPLSLSALVARGVRPGNTLLVTAGVHGDEFEGMSALWRLFAELQPSEMQGTLLAIPIANPPAYEAALRQNPDDRQDLARVFPGQAIGTVSEQIAHALCTHCFAHADFYCDLHSAGQYYTMPSLVGYQLREPALLSTQREAAHLFGLPIVWGTPSYPGRSLTSAGDLGVPALYVETTGEGRCRHDDVAKYLFGLKQLLAYLGIVGTVQATPPVRWVIEDASPEAGFLQVQNRAPQGGYFEARVTAWQAVEQGEVVGYLRDAWGEVRRQIVSAHTGRVVFLRTYPRVLAGEPLCTVLALSEREQPASAEPRP